MVFRSFDSSPEVRDGVYQEGWCVPGGMVPEGWWVPEGRDKLSPTAVPSQLSEGVGHLLFEVCKGVDTKFHSCSVKVRAL